jgi:hypothetical protein
MKACSLSSQREEPANHRKLVRNNGSTPVKYQNKNACYHFVRSTLGKRYLGSFLPWHIDLQLLQNKKLIFFNSKGMEAFLIVEVEGKMSFEGNTR